MDRAHRGRFEKLQASTSTLAVELCALDAQVREATTDADEVGRAAEAQRLALDSTTRADHELRTAMVRMDPWFPNWIVYFTTCMGVLQALLFWDGHSKLFLLGLSLGCPLGVVLAIVVHRRRVVRFHLLGEATRLKVVGVPLLAERIPVSIVAPGELTLESLERYVAALEAGVAERAAFLHAERTRKSLIVAESRRLEVQLQHGVAQRPELDNQHKSAQREFEERIRLQAEQSNGDTWNTHS